MILSPLSALLASRAAACAVCFSGAAAGLEGLFSGITWGIVILLTATFSSFGGLALMVMRIERARAESDGAGS